MLLRKAKKAGTKSLPSSTLLKITCINLMFYRLGGTIIDLLDKIVSRLHA